MSTIRIERKDNYAIVALDRPKVNAMNHEMVKELSAAFDTLENDEQIEGVILTGNPKIFTAGLDLVELYDYDEAKMVDFFTDFGGLHIQMVKFSKPLVCAMTGYSPAGGTVLAIAADYRIIADADKFGIGLNEVSVSVQIPESIVIAYDFWLGTGKSYKFIYTGQLLTPTEALNHGLVDEIVPQEEVLAKAEKFLQDQLRFDKTILKLTKQKLRAKWFRALDEIDHEADFADTLKVWWLPEIRQRMDMFRQWLKSK